MAGCWQSALDSPSRLQEIRQKTLRVNFTGAVWCGKWVERLRWLVTHSDKSVAAVAPMGGELDLLLASVLAPCSFCLVCQPRVTASWQNCSISSIHAEPRPTTTTNWLKSKCKPVTVQKDWQGLLVWRRRSMNWTCHEHVWQKWLQKNKCPSMQNKIYLFYKLMEIYLLV